METASVHGDRAGTQVENERRASDHRFFTIMTLATLVVVFAGFATSLFVGLGILASIALRPLIGTSAQWHAFAAWLVG